MDVTRYLYDAENSLRDYLHMCMCRQHGDKWAASLKETSELHDKWEARRVSEELSHNAIKGKEQLIHYATIEELREICELYWNADLQSTFGDREILDAHLRVISDYRDPNSRRRELFVFQKHLLIGISGDIRSKIALARNRDEKIGDAYPRLESVRDDKGNLWTAGMPRRMKSVVGLEVGSDIEFILTAVDPMGEDLSYRLHNEKWQSSNVIVRKIEPGMIGRSVLFHLTTKSHRRYHANRLGYDDKVTFEYEIVPKSEDRK